MDIFHDYISNSLRFTTIFNELVPCDIFADVGCDHGYITYAMLSSKKCNHAIVTDISSSSLKKAISILKDSHSGLFTAVCTDGLKDISYADQVLIAGMGGEEIIGIISNSPFKPERYVLQPMKNTEKVRLLLLNSGYKIVKDYIFEDKKYYDLVVAEVGNDTYTDDELMFGRDNLKSPNLAFKKYISTKISVLENAMPRMSEIERANAIIKIKKYMDVIS